MSASPSSSVAVSVYSVRVFAAVGVPVIVRVAGVNVSPAGSAGDRL